MRLMARTLFAIAACAGPTTLHSAVSAGETTTAPDASPRGARAFATQFNPNATGLDQKNAYLMMYLTAAVYPEGIQDLTGHQGISEYNKLHQDEKLFEREFRDQLSYLFDSPTFDFITTGPNKELYDPEAMVIDSPTAVFVIFRGTDRVGWEKVNSLQWSAGEWLTTDFDGAMIDPGDRIPGKVHKGFWFSMRIIRDDILTKVHQFNPRGQKKLWIAGHSLGAAMAQLFAAYAESKGVQVQGCYAFAAPHVGTDEFVRYLNSKVPSGRLQRFDFADDPITVLPPYAMGYQRAGVRNYYNDLNTFTSGAPERSITDDGLMLGLPMGAADTLADGVHIDLNSLANTCYHHTEWYLRAAYNQVARADRAKLPSPASFPLPTMADPNCGPVAVARAHTSDLGHVILESGQQIVQGSLHEINAAAIETKRIIDDSTKKAGEAAGEAVTTIAFNVDSLLQNATGSAVAEGNYYIRCLKGGKYLDVSASCLGEDGCKVQLWDLGKSATNNTFKVVREPPYYRIEIGSKVLDAEFEELADTSTTVQTWTRQMIPGVNQNQKWLFYKIKNNMYLVVSAANMKVLDAKDTETDKNGGQVVLRRGVSNDATQVWLLEKVH